MQIDTLIEECENLIRTGSPETAHKKLTSVHAADVSRDQRLALANLCRRVGLISSGLRLLTPLVHPDKGVWGLEATSAELAEHAMLLRKSGTAREALSTLNRADSNQTSEVFLNRAMCHIDLREYSEAVANLEIYLKQPEISPYKKLSASAHLASALFALDRWEQAGHFVNETIAQSTAENFNKITAQSLELRARIHLNYGRFNQARADLASSRDTVSIYKWSRIIDAMENRDKNILLEFRQDAAAHHNWETVREADRFHLKLEFDENRFNWLLFGTPFSAYRKSVEMEHQRSPARQELMFGDDRAPALDLVTGEITGPMICQAPPRLVHRLVNALLRDFYQPIPTGCLFAELFPGEYFNVFSSVHRVHQAIHRARKWFDSQKIPVAIVESQGHYSLAINGHFAVRVPYERQTLEAEARRFHALLQHFGSKGFTARQARQDLGLTPAVFKSLMNWAEETGNVSRLGAGPSTRYRILAPAKSA